MKTIFIDPNIKKSLQKQSRKNLFAFLVEKNAPIPEPAGSDLLIKTVACGICMTDINKILDPQKMIQQNRILDRKLGKQYLGHEVVGKVISTGSKRNKSMIGKLVTIGDINMCKSFSISPECKQCKKERGLLCSQKSNRKFNNSAYGGYSEYFIRSVYQCVLLPSNIDPLEATFIEPLSTAINCFKLCKNYDSIFINGLGTISTLFYRVLLIHGYNKKSIFLNVQNKTQKDQALAKGFKNVIINFSKQDIQSAKSSIDLLAKRPLGGFAIFIDFKGDMKDISNFMQHKHIRSTGQFLLFGMQDDRLNINFHQVINNEITIRGIHGYSSQFINGAYKSDLILAKDLISKKKLSVVDLISNKEDFSNAHNVLKDISYKIKHGNSIKVEFRTILV